MKTELVNKVDQLNNVDPVKAAAKESIKQASSDLMLEKFMTNYHLKTKNKSEETLKTLSNLSWYSQKGNWSRNWFTNQ